jgi:hypothetical protein
MDRLAWRLRVMEEVTRALVLSVEQNRAARQVIAASIGIAHAENRILRFKSVSSQTLNV